MMGILDGGGGTCYAPEIKIFEDYFFTGSE
jgi:hypothetical protein